MRQIKEQYPDDPTTPMRLDPGHRARTEHTQRYGHLPADEQRAVYDLLLGNVRLDDLPDQTQRVVRIYISSTFSDMVDERDHLVAEIYPDIRAYCRERFGVDLEIVDMRWGLGNLTIEDLSFSELCLKELEQCQKLSIGPNFVTFIGQKFGYLPVPAKIPRVAFEKILSCPLNGTKEKKLLQTWYSADINAMKNIFLLLPVRTVLGDEVHRWPAEKEEIVRSLSNALDFCASDPDIPASFCQQLSASLLQMEITKGILNMTEKSDVDANCVVFTRTMSPVEKILDRSRAHKFFDITQGTNNLNKDKWDAIQNLKKDKVLSKIDNRNVFEGNIPWSDPNGLDTTVHKEYLTKLGHFFYKRVRELLDHNMAQTNSIKGDGLFDEVLEQWHQARKHCKVHTQRSDLTDQIRHYIRTDTDTPLILHGASGNGKTTMMAKAASETHDWMTQEGRNVITRVILRFCGTTYANKDIRRLMHSLCHQLAHTTGNVRYLVPLGYKAMKRYFKDLLQSGEFPGILVIFLDGLNELSPQDKAHELDWLPSKLSHNVKIIVSTTEDSPILTKLHSKIPDKRYFVPVDSLKLSQSNALMKTLLERLGRTMTFSQFQVSKKAFAVCSSPLYTRLMYEEGRLWTSSTQLEGTVAPSSVTAILDVVFDRVEKSHGKLVTSHILSYLTASQAGLSRSELNDLLSLDDVVLNKVFVDWEPAVRRIPSVILPRLLHDIAGYLGEREVDETRVMIWDHRQFREVATKRYLSDNQHRLYIHGIMAHYFLGTWAGVRQKNFTYEEFLFKKLMKKKRESSAIRHVPDQPLVFKTYHSNARFNYRKLNQLPYHLHHGEMRQELRDGVYFNYEWLLTKIRATSVRQVLSDLVLSTDTDVGLVADALRMSEGALTEDPLVLGTEIVGRLLPYLTKYSSIKDLNEQCDLSSKFNCPLVPNWQIYTAPGGPLKYVCKTDPVINCDVDVDVIQRSDTVYITAKRLQDTRLRMWDTSLGEPLSDLELPAGSRIHPTPDGVYVNIFKNNRQLQTYRVDSGALCGQVDFEQGTLNHFSVTNRYIAFSYESMPSPVVIDVEASLVLHKFQYKCVEVCISQDNRFLMCNNGYSLQLHEMPLFERRCVVPTLSTPEKIVFMKDKQKAYILLKDKDIHQLNFSKKPKLTKVMHDLEMRDFKLSHCEDLLMVRASRCIFLFDTTKDTLRHRIQKMPKGIFVEHLSIFKDAGFTPDDKMLVAARHTYLGIWSTTTGEPIRLLQSSVSPIARLFTSDVARQAITLLADHTIQVWDLNKIDVDVQHHKTVVRGNIVSMAASTHAGSVICAGPRAAEAVIVKVQTGEVEHVLQHCYVENPLESVVISPSGTYAVTRMKNTDVPEYLQPWPLLKEDKLWSLKTGKQMRVIASNRLMAFASDDSKVVFFACRSYRTYDWNSVAYDAVVLEQPDNPEEDYVVELPSGDIVGQPLIVDRGKYLVFMLQHSQSDSSSDLINTIGDNSLELGLYLCVYSFDRVWKGLKYVELDMLWTGADKTNYFIDIKCANDENLLLTYGHGIYHYPHKEDGSLDRSQHTAKGLLLYSVAAGNVLRHITRFMSPESDISQTLLSRNGSILLDDKHQAFDGVTGSFICKLPLEDTIRESGTELIADGQYIVAITSNRLELVVYRTCDGIQRTRIFLHGVATYLTTCRDDRTVVVACEDGRLAMFTFVVGYANHYQEVIQKLPSRQRGIHQKTDTTPGVMEKDIRHVQNTDNEHQLISALTRKRLVEKRKRLDTFRALTRSVLLNEEREQETDNKCCIQ